MARLGDRKWTRKGLLHTAGQLLMSLSVLAAVIVAMVSGGERDRTAAVRERPFAEVARDDVEEPVWSLAFSRDGRYLAAATITGDVWIRDLADEQAIRLRKGCMSSARSVAFSPHGHILAVTGSAPGIRLWDLESATELPALAVEGEATARIAFSRDGTKLAIGQAFDANGQGIVTLWDFRTRRRLAILGRPFGGVRSLTFSPDDSRVAATTTQGWVTIWETATRLERVRLHARAPGSGNIVTAEFSPDGRYVATGALYEPFVRLWSAVDGRPSGHLPGAVLGMHAVAFSPDGKVLALARADGVAVFWDLATGRKLGTVRARDRALHSLAFSPTGVLLATGGADGAVRLWDVEQAVDKSLVSH
jgi:WD40 repeat protein